MKSASASTKTLTYLHSVWSHSCYSWGPGFSSGFILTESRTGGYPQAGAVGVPASAEPPARLGIDFGVVGHGQADLALVDVAFQRGASLRVCLDVLLAD